MLRGFKKWQMTVFAALLLAAFSLPALAAEEKVFNWRIVAAWPAGMPIYKDIAGKFVENIEYLSKGRIKLQLMPGGTVAPTLETTNAVQTGIIQMAVNVPYYDIGKDPATVLFGGYPSGPDPDGMVTWLYEDGGQQMMWDYYLEKFNVISIPCGMMPAELFAHSNVPIKSLADFKGMKFRTSGAWADILAEMGTSVIALDSSEIYQALERKIVDAVEMSTAGQNLLLGYHEAAKYIGAPGVHQPVCLYNLQVNKKAWDSLPEDLQELVRIAAFNTTFSSYLRGGYLDMKAMDTYAKNGNILVILDEESQLKIQEMGVKWGEERSKDNAWFKKVFDSQQGFLKQWRPSKVLRTFVEPK